jgi:transposase
MNREEKKISVSIVNENAAGIDIGSKSHFVAVGQNPEDVMEFGIDTASHQKMITFLKRHWIKTIAMESTGSYWQTLFAVLQEADFEVLLVPGSQTKNGIKKTDVKDCQWIQKLHMLGLLSGCFLPDEQTMRIRNISRHRASLVEQSAKYTNKIQKALRLMNLRLDASIRDVVGKTGMRIIEAILAGERDASKLVELVDNRVKKSREEIILNLNGQWNDELLYELKDCVELLKIHNSKITDCDKKIEIILDEFNDGKAIPENIELVKKQEKGKHACSANLSEHSYKLYGVDLMAINGIGPGVMLTILSELGLSIHQFETSKQFCSWLRLSPNNKISGGNILSSRTEKTKNNLSKAFKDAANAVGLSKKNDALCHFFRKIGFKKGRGAAIKATARKIAIIVYKMITTKQGYQPISNDDYQSIQRKRKIKYLQNDIKKYNISILDLQLAAVS